MSLPVKFYLPHFLYTANAAVYFIILLFLLRLFAKKNAAETCCAYARQQYPQQGIAVIAGLRTVFRRLCRAFLRFDGSDGSEGFSSGFEGSDGSVVLPVAGISTAAFFIAACGAFLMLEPASVAVASFVRHPRKGMRGFFQFCCADGAFFQ